MSLEITLHPTADGMRRALNYKSTGIKIDAKYIGVGEGLQEIVLDGAKRSVINQLKKPVAWLEILTAVRIDDYQHQMMVDLKGIRATEWDFSECCLADENKDVIAIYGSATQALMTVSPVIDRNFLAINMALKSMAAGSINIVHQGIPLELFNLLDLLSMHNSVGQLAVNAMLRQRDELLESITTKAAEDQQNSTLLELQSQIVTLKNLLQQASTLLQSTITNQELFNVSTHNAIGRLAVSAMQYQQQELVH